jgi:hypothetical protein
VKKDVPKFSVYKINFYSHFVNEKSFNFRIPIKLHFFIPKIFCPYLVEAGDLFVCLGEAGKRKDFIGLFVYK